MKKPTVKMSLSLDKDFYDLIQHNARLNYIKPSTWVKQQLMRSILKNNDDEKVMGIEKFWNQIPNNNGWFNAPAIFIQHQISPIQPL